MNYIVITIDALSKWYINHIRPQNGFWKWLKDNSVSFENMYSVGPFTEAAVRGLWAGLKPLQRDSYLSETAYSKETIFDTFHKRGYYVYLGELVPFYNFCIKSENEIQREKCETRGFEHLWRNRLVFYSDLYQGKLFESKDIWKVQYILDDFFEKYKESELVRKQSELYARDKKTYIYNVLDRREGSNLFLALDNDLLSICKYNNYYNIDNQSRHELSLQEAYFIKNVKNANLKRYYLLNNKDIEGTNEVINSGNNRCINSNNDVLAHMRDEAEVLPKLNEELDELVKWYDKTGRWLDRPFFAYIHNYDFHYPENFMEYRCSDKKRYDAEVEDLSKILNWLPDVPMSISKQLSIIHIENCLKRFYDEIDKRDVLKNTRVVFTADHGIANYMFKNNSGIKRWNYTSINFHVPLFITGAGIEPYTVDSLVDNTCFFDVITSEKIEEKCRGIEEKNARVISTNWINGVPDLDRAEIKLGVRNKRFSITFQGLFTQLFQSLKILGVYDLVNDPDEIYPLNPEVLFDIDADILNYAKEEWIKVVLSIMSDSNKKYEYSRKYAYVLEDTQSYRNLNTIYKWRNLEFERTIEGKEVIVFGRGDRAKRFLNQYGNKCIIKEIWDNKCDCEYYYGHPLCKPYLVSREILIIICSRYEIEIIEQLKEMGVMQFILFDSVLIEGGA